MTATKLKSTATALTATVFNIGTLATWCPSHVCLDAAIVQFGRYSHGWKPCRRASS